MFTRHIREKFAKIMSLLGICIVCILSVLRRRKKTLTSLGKLKKITRQFQIPLAFGELASGYFHPCHYVSITITIIISVVFD
jgi:hypothetical protein